jgi:hypothetical protein
MWVFSQWWLYAPLGIPFIGYLMFFLFKWAIISAPIWIPIKAAMQKDSLFNIKFDKK